MILYVDGQPTESNTVSLSIGNNSLPLLIGGIFDTFGFGGVIDDVRIYNRALTESEVGDIFSEY